MSRETSEDIKNGKQIRISKEAYDIVVNEKTKQKKTIARITSDLIIKEYKQNEEVC